MTDNDLSWEQLWTALEPEQQRQAVNAFWSDAYTGLWTACTGTGREAMIRSLCEATRVGLRQQMWAAA